MTQAEKILSRLKTGGITTADAVGMGIKCLSGRICQLRQAGHDIRAEVVAKKDQRIVKRFYIHEAKNYKRGQKKKEHATTREYTCDLGDTVIHQGRRVLVTEIIDQGSESKQRRAYIKCCPITADGHPLRRCNVFCGTEWER